MLKISRSTAARLVADGLEPINGHGYPVDQARKLLSIRALRSRTMASDPDGVELRRQKLALDVERARADLAITKSEWVERTTVEKEWRRALIAAKTALLGLGRQLAPRLVNIGVLQIQSLIDQAVIDALKRLAHPQHCPVEQLEADLTHNSKGGYA